MNDADGTNETASNEMQEIQSPEQTETEGDFEKSLDENREKIAEDIRNDPDLQERVGDIASTLSSDEIREKYDALGDPNEKSEAFRDAVFGDHPEWTEQERATAIEEAKNDWIGDTAAREIYGEALEQQVDGVNEGEEGFNLDEDLNTEVEEGDGNTEAIPTESPDDDDGTSSSTGDPGDTGPRELEREYVSEQPNDEDDVKSAEVESPLQQKEIGTPMEVMNNSDISENEQSEDEKSEDAEEAPPVIPEKKENVHEMSQDDKEAYGVSDADIRANTNEGGERAYGGGFREYFAAHSDGRDVENETHRDEEINTQSESRGLQARLAAAANYGGGLDVGQNVSTVESHQDSTENKPVVLSKDILEQAFRNRGGR